MCFLCASLVVLFLSTLQDAAAAMSELELLFKYLDAMGTLKVRLMGACSAEAAQ